jgi:hypothetical protein
MCSSDRVMSVVAADSTMVAAIIAATAHSGKCAGAVLSGGGGGTGATEGSGGAGVAEATGVRTIAAARKTARPPHAVIMRRLRGMLRPAGRGGDDAGRWLIGLLLRLPGGRCLAACSAVRTDSTARGRWNGLEIGSEAAWTALDPWRTRVLE